MPLNELDIGKYLENFMDLIGPEEAEAFPKVKIPKELPKTGMSMGAKAMAEKGASAKMVAHHTLPLGVGPPDQVMRQLDWHLRNLPEAIQNPENIGLKDVSTKWHKKHHAKETTRLAQQAKERKQGMIPPAENIKAMSTQEKEGLWKALQGNVEVLKRQNPTISEQLAQMKYTPEYRREILQDLATTPERKALYANAGEQAATVIDELVQANPGLKVYLGGSYAAKGVPNPKDIDLFAPNMKLRAYVENKGLNLPPEEKGVSKVHMTTYPTGMSQDPMTQILEHARNKYGPNFDFIKLASVLGVPMSTIISRLQEQE